jgi:hypothetical protein
MNSSIHSNIRTRSETNLSKESQKLTLKLCGKYCCVIYPKIYFNFCLKIEYNVAFYSICCEPNRDDP